MGTQCVLAGECLAVSAFCGGRLRVPLAGNYLRTGRAVNAHPLPSVRRVPCLHTSGRACVTLAAGHVQVCTTMSKTHEAFADRESALVFCP